MPQTINESAEPGREKFVALLTDFIADLSERNAVLDMMRPLDTTRILAYETINNLSGREKVAFIRHLFCRIAALRSHPGSYAVRAGEDGYLCLAYRDLFRCLMKGKVAFEPEEPLVYIAECLDLNAKDGEQFLLKDFPLASLARQFERAISNSELSQPLRHQVNSILEIPTFPTDPRDNATDAMKMRAQLFKLVHRNGDTAPPIPRYTRLIGDPFGETVAARLAAMPEKEQSPWYALFYVSEAVSGSKPSEEYLAIANELIDQIGADMYRSQVLNWFQVAIDVPVRSEQHTRTYSDGATHEFTTYHHLTENNRNLLKGLVWTIMRFDDAETLRMTAKFAERCFAVIPGKGPAAAGVGNACLLVLAEAKGLDGVSHLSRLKLRIRQPATRKLIQQHIEEQADKLGLNPARIEELAAPDFDLDHGQRSEAFDDYRLTMNLHGIGKVDSQWLKPDGSPQKSVPAFVKSSKEHAARLKALQAISKEIQQASSAQRDRIDRLFVEDMSWGYDDFRQFYLDHGVVSVIASKLIWQLVDSGGSPTAALYVGDGWQSVSGAEIRPGPDTTVRMWHPIEAGSDAVRAWRDRLDTLGITQPMKQAYREVYVVTDAEHATRSYSNRMAAHILKQHQFSALAGVRGWNYSLLSANDDGRDDDAARKVLPAYGITAEYWIDELQDNADRLNDSGIWDYVATDQVLFLDAGDNPIDLVAVPAIVFSEVMRDVDLFVGVASVGNDPEWHDHGATREERDYWQAYSFGDLSEVAKTRTAVLERLLPRLKIRNQAHIDGKFLIVDGKRHTYKIHIGSTNILILPDDRYLCIVPGRGRDKDTDAIHLPFEGDRGMSILLSKAFMLANDDKITDPTILSQL